MSRLWPTNSHFGEDLIKERPLKIFDGASICIHRKDSQDILNLTVTNPPVVNIIFSMNSSFTIYSVVFVNKGVLCLHRRCVTVPQITRSLGQLGH